MNTRSTTRRDMLTGAAGLLAAPLIASAGAAAAAARPLDRLARSIALHDRSAAAEERFYPIVEAARAAYRADVDALPIELPPPHEESATTFVNIEGETRRLSTANGGTYAVARKVVNDPTWADMGDEDWRQAHRELVAAHDRREAIIAAQKASRAEAEARLRGKHRIGQLIDREDALGRRTYDLWRAVIDAPASTMADVILKLDFIARTTAPVDIDSYHYNAVVADVRRLAGGAA